MRFKQSILNEIVKTEKRLSGLALTVFVSFIAFFMVSLGSLVLPAVTFAQDTALANNTWEKHLITGYKEVVYFSSSSRIGINYYETDGNGGFCLAKGDLYDNEKKLVENLYSYDDQGQVAQMDEFIYEDASGDQYLVRNTYTYDEKGQLIQQSEESTSEKGGFDPKDLAWRNQTTRTYDAFGNVTCITTEGIGVSKAGKDVSSKKKYYYNYMDENGSYNIKEDSSVKTYTVDEKGRTILFTNVDGGVLVEKMIWEYRMDGQLLHTENYSVGEDDDILRLNYTVDYEYNENDQLLSVTTTAGDSIDVVEYRYNELEMIAYVGRMKDGKEIPLYEYEYYR